MKYKILLTGLLLVAAVLFAFQAAPRKLFVLGDSISLQYGVYLEKYLKGEYIIERKGSVENAMKNLDVPIDANGGDSHMVLDYLQTRANDSSFHPDLMLLNCGLHDIKRNPKTNQIAVDSASYRHNLEVIYTFIQHKKIPVIWVRTTEVVDSIHAEKSKAFNRYAKDLNAYNQIADEVCKKFSVSEIDLYSFTRKQGADRYADHVHYIPRVVEAQARFIVDYIRKYKK